MDDEITEGVLISRSEHSSEILRIGIFIDWKAGETTPCYCLAGICRTAVNSLTVLRSILATTFFLKLTNSNTESSANGFDALFGVSILLSGDFWKAVFLEDELLFS